MDELTTRKTQLPDTIEDLSQFVLVNRAKLDAYRVKLRTINRLSDAQEIREQTLQEMQDISSALIAAETRIGEILLSIPSASGRRTDLETSSNHSEKVMTKSETTEQMGYTRHEVSDYQRMAQNQAVVNLVLEQAEREGRVVSHSEVMKRIKAKDAEIERLTRNYEGLDRANKILAKEANQGGKVVEKVVEVEVVPDDYEQAKRDAEIAKRDFKASQKQYEEMAEKWKASERERERLLKEKNDPDTKEAERIKLNAMSLVAGVSNFLEKFGGYSFLMSEINSLPKQQKDAVNEAVNAMNNWVSAMLNETVSEVIE